MLVTRILGDCPGCAGKQQFGNVSVLGNRILRGCMNCNYEETILLPEIRKKILYLDQFFFSNAFKKGDQRFVTAARRIQKLSALQLLAIPFSSVHEDETHQWRGYGDKNKEDLMEFIKATSRGREFKPSYNVEKTQIVSAFQAYLKDSSSTFELQPRHAIPSDIHEWDDYFRIDVGHYLNDIESMRDMKRKSVELLVDAFPAWQKSTLTFEQEVAHELDGAARKYLHSYATYAVRIATGDFSAVLDSPTMALVVETLLHCLPEGASPEELLRRIATFFLSEHFSEIPYQWLSARIYASLKDMVKRGAYAKRDAAQKKLAGFFQDVKHVSIYAPYCDAFVMDKSMAAVVADRRISLEGRYGVKIFSLSNWDEFLAWLNALEAQMSREHLTGYEAAYL